VIRNAGPAQAPRVPAQQIRRHARFIDKHILRRIMKRHRLLPFTPGGGDIGSALFVGVYRFF
jgi:hypothetical protein